MKRMKRTTFRCRLLTTVMLALVAAWAGSAALAQGVIDDDAGPAVRRFADTISPGAAPVAPSLSIWRSGGSAIVSWYHESEDTGYEVWRSTLPYFDPALGEGNKLIDFSSGPASTGDPFDCTDNGNTVNCTLNSSPFAGSDPSPNVTVIGDVNTNYFWVVRGRNGDGVSDNSNRVGEFDFALVPGS